MKYMIITKTEDKIKLEPYNPTPKQKYEYNYLSTKDKHLCWGCKNGYPSKCPKIFDRENTTIDKFKFIKDGYQIVDENGVVQTFVVSKCANFEKSIDLNKKESKRKSLVRTYSIDNRIRGNSNTIAN